ncbi:restriction endonuclease [Natrinema pallidum DSM 3751]|uniref:Restriction endonuclease n=1 Tax=Natrinema pallidum DSM 3751 TaxID=1227495 RepID=L9Z7X8_9EURY|nr:hypothetical protein [Natrinema pallidum]ELY82605.1 restriction endonuclease [Natrinema pallidum DSM 3751]
MVETAADVRWIVVGMQDSDEVPSERDVKSALQFLGDPSIGVVEQTEEGYRIVTSYENAVQLVRSFGEVVQPPEEEK